MALALFGSHQTLNAAQTLARQLGMSPFLIGMTVVAFGTDLPEIANSITASLSRGRCLTDEALRPYANQPVTSTMKP